MGEVRHPSENNTGQSGGSSRPSSKCWKVMCSSGFLNLSKRFGYRFATQVTAGGVYIDLPRIRKARERISHLPVHLTNILCQGDVPA
jgi:hypothetical protein